MAALTGENNAVILRDVRSIAKRKVTASATVWKGALLEVNTTDDRSVRAGQTASAPFAGIALDTVVAPATGDVYVDVAEDCIAEITSALDMNPGVAVYVGNATVPSDNLADVTATATNNMLIGNFVQDGPVSGRVQLHLRAAHI
jgi:hypothetical protein